MLGTLFFDKQDRELLRMINETIDHGPSQDLEHKVFDANLHPHGILELTTTHEYRMGLSFPHPGDLRMGERGGI